MFCRKCGSQMGNTKFCPNCGTQAFLPTSPIEQSKQGQSYDYTQPRLYEKPKRKHIGLKVVGVLMALIVFSSILSSISKGFNEAASKETSESIKATSESIKATSVNSVITPTSNKSSGTLFSEIKDLTLVSDFIQSCNQVGIDTSLVKDITQKGDWVGGPRYTFTYRGTTLILYCNTDSTVHSINIINLKIYYRGYNPLNVNDYLVDIAKIAELQVYTQEYVKQALKYPKEAEFPWFDWGFSRFGKIYAVSTTVTAKNAFNVESELNCYLEYEVSDTELMLKYFILDGKEMLGTKSAILEIEREKQSGFTDSTSAENALYLVEGELGEYGKEVTIDGNKYIWYVLPVGKYDVTSKVSYCKVYLDKDKSVKNSDGYTEHVNVTTLEFTSGSGKQTLEIREGEHIFLTINARVELVPTE